MKHKYRDILTVSWRMSFSFACRTAHVYAGLYRAPQKYPAPFRHHSIQKTNTIYERLTAKNIRPCSDVEDCNPYKSKKDPLKHLISAGWQVASIRIFCLSRFRHQSVEVTLIIFVLNDIDRFFHCQQLV